MLFRRKKLIKNCMVFLSDKHQHLVIAARQENKAGIIMEQEECITMEFPASEEKLGMEVVKAVNKYRLLDISVANFKKTDWPAYKASKSKSVRAFEADYTPISVTCQNSGNIILDIDGKPYQRSVFSIKSTIPFHVDKDQIGSRVLRLFEVCKSGTLK
jgi:hypothetical protein